MLQAVFPAGVWSCIHEMVMVVTESFFMHTVIKETSRHWFLGVARIHAGLIECHRIKTCKHPDIREDRNVIFSVTVTVRRDVDDKIDVEVRAAVQNCFGVFGNFHIQLFDSGRVFVVDGVKVAGPKAAPASYTFCVVNGCLTVLVKGDGSMGTVLEQVRHPTQRS